MLMEVCGLHHRLLLREMEKLPGEEKSMVKNQDAIHRLTGLNIVLDTQANVSVLTPSATYRPSMDLLHKYTQYISLNKVEKKT